MKLPSEFKWLAEEPGPKMLLAALPFYGLREFEGPANNPIILEWAKELGLEKIYTADSIPWCGLFHALIAKRAGKPVPENPLWAKNWANWGKPSPTPSLGDTLVFNRSGGGGHVGNYVAENFGNYFVLGANQRDQVCIVPIKKSRLIAARRNYIVTPSNIRKIFLNDFGTISDNEA